VDRLVRTSFGPVGIGHLPVGGTRDLLARERHMIDAILGRVSERPPPMRPRNRKDREKHDRAKGKSARSPVARGGTARGAPKTRDAGVTGDAGDPPRRDWRKKSATGKARSGRKTEAPRRKP
jgi:hypothetical protein